MSIDERTDSPQGLSNRFKIGAGLSIACVIAFSVALLYYVSTVPCPTYLFSYPLRTQECDLSNILGVIISLIVAGIFAIILSLIFYEKQKIDSQRIEKLAQQELALTQNLSQVNGRLSDLEFEQRRLNGCRMLVRNLQDLSEIIQIIRPLPDRGIFRPIRHLNRRDDIVNNIREIIDTTTFSRNSQFPLAATVEQLCTLAMQRPDRNTITVTDEVFVVPEQDYDNLQTRITQMIGTINNFQGAIISRTEANFNMD